MGNGNIDVGTKTPTRKTGRPKAGRWFGSKVLPDGRIGLPIPPLAEHLPASGAMAEQRGDIGRSDQSAPQKLVRLVGCREVGRRPGICAADDPGKPVERG